MPTQMNSRDVVTRVTSSKIHRRKPAPPLVATGYVYGYAAIKLTTELTCLAHRDGTLAAVVWNTTTLVLSQVMTLSTTSWTIQMIAV